MFLALCLLFPCRYRRTKIGGLPDLARVVNESSTVNVVQVKGKDGTVVVTTYDWTSFLEEHVDKCVGIKSFHHLLFSSAAKGHVSVRERSDSPEEDILLLKDAWSPSASDLPPVLTPKGLNLTRQWYLYNKIREFCPDNVKDTTCPRPCETEPGTAPSISYYLI